MLGCGNFGGIGSLPHLYGKGKSESESFAILEEAINLGIRRFDTANSYGGGFSENILGKFIKGLDIKIQKQIYISTKVGNPFAGSKNRNSLDSNEIEFQVEQSLQRIGKKIDILYIHELNKDVKLGLLVNTLLKLIKKDLIKSIGFSNVHVNEVKTLVELLGPDVNNFRSIQNEFHLLKTNDLDEFIPFLSKHSISYSAYSPLAGGLLTGKYLSGHIHEGSRLSLRPEPYQIYQSIECQNLIKRHLQQSLSLGISPEELAIRSILSQPLIESVVIGPR